MCNFDNNFAKSKSMRSCKCKLPRIFELLSYSRLTQIFGIGEGYAFRYVTSSGAET